MQRARVQQIVDDVNRERSRYEQIKRFSILPRDFTTGQDVDSIEAQVRYRRMGAYRGEQVRVAFYDAAGR